MLILAMCIKYEEIITPQIIVSQQKYKGMINKLNKWYKLPIFAPKCLLHLQWLMKCLLYALKCPKTALQMTNRLASKCFETTLTHREKHQFIALESHARVTCESDTWSLLRSQSPEWNLMRYTSSDSDMRKWHMVTLAVTLGWKGICSFSSLDRSIRHISHLGFHKKEWFGFFSSNLYVYTILALIY